MTLNKFSITAAIFTNSSGTNYECIEVAIDHVVSNIYIYFMQIYAKVELSMTSIFINSTMDETCTGYFSLFKQINSRATVRIESVIIEGTYQVQDTTQNSLIFLYANDPKLLSMKRVSITPKLFKSGPNSAFFVTYYYNRKTEFTGGDIHGLNKATFAKESYSGKFLLIDCFVSYGSKGTPQTIELNTNFSAVSNMINQTNLVISRFDCSLYFTHAAQGALTAVIAGDANGTNITAEDLDLNIGVGNNMINFGTFGVMNASNFYMRNCSVAGQIQGRAEKSAFLVGETTNARNVTIRGVTFTASSIEPSGTNGMLFGTFQANKSEYALEVHDMSFYGCKVTGNSKFFVSSIASTQIWVENITIDGYEGSGGHILVNKAQNCRILVNGLLF